MPVQPTTPTGGALPPGGPSAPQAPGSLGKDDFLKLLVGQLRNQDPLNPVEDQAFISQMTAFSTLEQVTNIAVTAEQLGSITAANQSLGLIGRRVSYLDADGNEVEGTVERVRFENGVPLLTVDGTDGIAPGQVIEVR